MSVHNRKIIYAVLCHRHKRGERMTKDILISISGLQVSPENESDTVEVISPGEYYYRNDKHFVVYEEATDGQTQTVKNMVKISDECVEVTKKGPASIHMIFEKNKKNVTYYYTPFGNLQIGIDTRSINIEENEDSIKVNVEYTLDINSQHAADCNIAIEIREKGNKGFRLV